MPGMGATTWRILRRCVNARAGRLGLLALELLSSWLLALGSWLLAPELLRFVIPSNARNLGFSRAPAKPRSLAGLEITKRFLLLTEIPLTEFPVAKASNWLLRATLPWHAAMGRAFRNQDAARRRPDQCPRALAVCGC